MFNTSIWTFIFTKWVFLIKICASQVLNCQKIDYQNYQVRLLSEFDATKVNKLKYVHFDDFKQLKLNDSKLTNINNSKISYFGQSLDVDFIPSTRTVLDRSLSTVDYQKFTPSDAFVFRFVFLAGFDVQYFQINFSSNYRDMEISFRFFLCDLSLHRSGKRLTTAQCNEQIFDKKSYFNRLDYLEFRYATRYSTQTCKYIFKNSQLAYVYFLHLSQAFIKRNLLGFIPPTSLTHLNSEIKNALFYVYLVSVDERLLDVDVFAQIRTLTLIGQVVQIKPELIGNFKQLLKIELKSPNLRSFFNMGLQWIRSCYIERPVNLSNKSDLIEGLNNRQFLVIQTFQKSYAKFKTDEPFAYPDEDFCLFVDFPFDRLVFVDPHLFCLNFSCSCTRYYLLQYVHLFGESRNGLNFLYEFDINPFRFSTFAAEIEACNFSRRVNACKRLETYKKRPFRDDLTYDDALADSQWIDFISVILIPIVSVLSVSINILNIRVIASIDLNKSPEELKQKSLVRFMLAYAVLNVAYDAIHLVSLVGKCVDDVGVFCSRLYYTLFAQYYQMICVEFIGANLKTYSNIVYVCISINRYILLEKESKLAVFIHARCENMSKKVKITLGLSLFVLITGLNSHKIVIYQPFYDSILNILYEQKSDLMFMLPFFVTTSLVYERHFNYESHAVLRAKSTIYMVFTLVNFVINDVVVFLIFTLVDVYLIKSLRKSTDKKKIIWKDKLNDSRIKNQLNELEQTVRNVLKVIVVNTVVLLTVKSFDLAMIVSKFLIWNKEFTDILPNRKLGSFCYTIKICLSYEELVRLAYMLYYCFSLVAFYYLNKNFRTNLNLIQCCAKRR